MQGYAERSDKALLEAFLNHRDEAAFAALVRRYETLVANIGVRVLDNAQDARDVAQSVFLTLALKAGRLDLDRPLAPWLHRVASRTAWAVRRERESRRKRERAAMPDPSEESRDARVIEELGPILDGEMDRLPERYRRPLVLFHLEGRTLEETAHLLERSVGTVGSWLSRGRELLRDRLVRRGVTTLSVGLLTTYLSRDALAHEVSLGFARTTASAATAAAAGRAGSVVSAHVIRLTEGALKMLSAAKLKTAVLSASAAAGVIACLAFVFTVGTMESESASPRAAQAAEVRQEPPPQEEKKPAPAPAPQEKESTLKKGLVGHWKLDEGTSSTEAPDASGKAHAGRLIGQVGWGNGKILGALRLDGKGAHVELPYTDALRSLIQGSFTVSAWFKPDDIPPGFDSDNNAHYAIVARQGWTIGLVYTNEQQFKLDYWLKPADEEPKWAGTGSWDSSFNPGVWHHVVGMVNRASGETVIYVNGERKNGDGWDPSTPAHAYIDQPWRIGIGAPEAEQWSWPAKGSIDDVRFYNRVLSATEVKELYEAASREE